VRVRVLVRVRVRVCLCVCVCVRACVRACVRICSVQARMTSSGTGLENSRRLRTARVVDKSSSGFKGSNDTDEMVALFRLFCGNIEVHDFLT
jgi:hypothetical protein